MSGLNRAVVVAALAVGVIFAGGVIRVTDSEAEKRVKSGYWMYVAKVEWKATKPTKTKSTEEVETKSKKHGKKK